MEMWGQSRIRRHGGHRDRVPTTPAASKATSRRSYDPANSCAKMQKRGRTVQFLSLPVRATTRTPDRAITVDAHCTLWSTHWRSVIANRQPRNGYKMANQCTCALFRYVPHTVHSIAHTVLLSRVNCVTHSIQWACRKHHVHCTNCVILIAPLS